MSKKVFTLEHARVAVGKLAAIDAILESLCEQFDVSSDREIEQDKADASNALQAEIELLQTRVQRMQRELNDSSY